MHPIIDTHQHLWDLDKVELPWLEWAEPLKKNHLPSDYAQAIEGHNVVKSIYMEVDVAPHQKDLEVELISDLCRDPNNPMVGAVISGAPGTEGFRDYIDRHKTNPYVKGVRRVLHVPEAPQGLCLESSFIEDLHYLGEHGLLFDICIRPAELMDTVALAKQCPNTTFILDHCGNADPKIVNGSLSDTPTDDMFWHRRDDWFAAIEQLGALPNVIVKISGIVARTPENWTAQDLAPTVNHCLDAFGADRVIFGGDWPVCTLGSSFNQWTSALREIVKNRSDDDQRKLFSENAERIYQV